MNYKMNTSLPLFFRQTLLQQTVQIPDMASLLRLVWQKNLSHIRYSFYSSLAI